MATVINAAAYTDVERAEDDEERAFAVNCQGARNVAEAAAEHRLALVHVSTDFVFDGSKSGPYTEEDEPHPLNAYGRSKLAGDRSVTEAHAGALVVRTAWVFGPGGVNFPAKIVALAQARDEIQVVDDEFGSPTASIDLARGILELRGFRATGLFHLTGSGSCSRYELGPRDRFRGRADHPGATRRPRFLPREGRPAGQLRSQLGESAAAGSRDAALAALSPDLRTTAPIKGGLNEEAA